MRVAAPVPPGGQLATVAGNHLWSSTGPDARTGTQVGLVRRAHAAGTLRLIAVLAGVFVEPDSLAAAFLLVTRLRFAAGTLSQDGLQVGIVALPIAPTVLGARRASGAGGDG